jgi:hypothetical protein
LDVPVRLERNLITGSRAVELSFLARLSRNSTSLLIGSPEAAEAVGADDARPIKNVVAQT